MRTWRNEWFHAFTGDLIPVIDDAARVGTEGLSPMPETNSEWTKERRRSWARLIRRVYEADPLPCRCGQRMRVVGFITQVPTIRKILHHVGQRFEPLKLPGRAPPLFDYFLNDPFPMTNGPQEEDRKPDPQGRWTSPRCSRCPRNPVSPFSSGQVYWHWAEAGKGFANRRWIFDPWRPVEELGVVKNTTAGAEFTIPAATSEKRNFLSHFLSQVRLPVEVSWEGKDCRWWTRSQRIRTEGEMPFKPALLGLCEPPAYQRIAEKAFLLNQVGINPNRISAHLGVDRSTVARALRWWMG